MTRRTNGPPVISLALEPRTDADAQKLAGALERICAVDEALSIQRDTHANRVVIACVSEQHLEAVIDRLWREFQVEATVGRPQVLYKETVTRAAIGESRYILREPGRTVYAHVRLCVNPGEPGSGYVLEDRTAGGSIPAKFIESVRQGVSDALSHGVLAGHRVDDVRVQLDDGSYHETDSSEEAFRKAGALAFADAARKADPVVLEPMLRVRTVVPSEDAIGVTEMLCSRGGDIRSADILGDAKTIEARVPVSGLFGCGAELRSRTGGRGTCSMVFDGYRPIRGTPDVADEDRESRVGAPRRPSPKPRRDAVALPEPDDGAKD